MWIVFHECNHLFTVPVKDLAAQATRASLFLSLKKSNVGLNLIVVTIPRATEGRPNVQRRYREQIRLDATRALK